MPLPIVPVRAPFSPSSSVISFSSSLHRFSPNPLLSTLFGGGCEGFRTTTSPFLIRMGGGPRTYPGGVTKWQWKRMQAKKSKQLLKARLLRERQLYEMRKRTELRAAVAELERPWEVVERAPNLFSVSADDQVKVLADRFQRPGGIDLWNDRDGPQVFRAPDGLKSARFFPKGVVHSVKPYGIVNDEEYEGEDEGEEGAVNNGDEVFVDLSLRRDEGAKRRSMGRRSRKAWGREEDKDVSGAIDIEATILNGDKGSSLGVKNSKCINWIDKSEEHCDEETTTSGNRLTRRRQGSRNRISPNGFRSSTKHSQVINAESQRDNFSRRNVSYGDHLNGTRPGSENKFSPDTTDQLPSDTNERTGNSFDANSSRRRHGSRNWVSLNEYSSSTKHSQAIETETRRTSFDRRNINSSYSRNRARPGSWSRFGAASMDQLPSDTTGGNDNMAHSRSGNQSSSRSNPQRVSLRPTTSLYYKDGSRHRERNLTWNIKDELEDDF